LLARYLPLYQFALLLLLLLLFHTDLTTTENYTLSYTTLFRSHEYVKHIVGQSRTTVNFTDIMDNGKILFVKLSGTLAPKVEDLIDRKSTRLNSSHQIISYAVFCLKKKTTKTECTSSNQIKTYL